MMGWGVFFAALAGPLAKRVLIALGFGLITFVGLSAVKDELYGYIYSSLGAMGGVTYQILALAGLIDAIGIWMGAISTIVSFAVIRKLGILG